MILSNIGLQAALDAGRIRIDPEPEPREQNPDDPAQYCPYETHAVDLTLGSEIIIVEEVQGKVSDKQFPMF